MEAAHRWVTTLPLQLVAPAAFRQHRSSPSSGQMALLRGPAAAGCAPLLAGALLIAGLPAPLLAQDLVGCQLVGASLQCVPGLTADPQQQIRILNQQIQGDLQVEGAVEQRIEGLSRLELAGQAVEGAVIRAKAIGSGTGLPPAKAFHWYRLSPGAASWILIPAVDGPTYVPQAVDVGQTLRVVLVVPRSDGVRRVISNPVGPVRRSPLKNPPSLTTP
jgi:hypothetical protein